MKPLWIVVLATTLLCCGPAFSQVSGVGSPTPGTAATSPLSMTPGASVPPTGIPLGATELASPGLSPVTVGTPGMTGYGATCSAGSPASGTSGTYDGGGIALGMGTALPGSMATCTGSGNSVPSTDAASSTVPSVARAGIPLGSVEIGNAGVSPLLTAPTPSASPSMYGTLSLNPSTMGAPATPPSTMGAAGVFSPTTGVPTALSTDGTGQPCGSVPTSTRETGC
jgi:hypothetical protein